jgi:hypothetical protein
MPSVSRRLLNATVFLFEDESSARAGGPGGSGFLVGTPCAVPNAVFLWAVTNAHVAATHPVVRTSGPPEKCLFPRSSSDWIRHADGDDLVITPIGFCPADCRSFYLDYVPRDWFARPALFGPVTIIP